MKTTLEQFIDGEISGQDVLDLVSEDTNDLVTKLRRHGITNQELGEFVIDGAHAVVRAAHSRIAAAGTYEQAKLEGLARHAHAILEQKSASEDEAAREAIATDQISVERELVENSARMQELMTLMATSTLRMNQRLASTEEKIKQAVARERERA